MKIVGSNVQMTSQHEQVERNEKREELRAWRDGPNGARVELKMKDLGVSMAAAFSREALQGVTLQLSQQAKALQPAPVQVPVEDIPEPGEIDDFRIQLLKAVMEQLTGRKFEVFDPHELEQKVSKSQAETPELRDPNAASSQQGGNAREGWGLVYDSYSSHFESESTQFSAQGTIKTADGKEISFTLDLSMSRTFMSEQRINIRAGDALKDPLVINFSGTAAQLTQDKYSFDIDSDGRSDQISFVAPGSGFLALDANNNGKVDTGSELFGTKSGDGFADLAKYDSDHNNWIDEGDTIYANLRIWSKDASGKDQLVALGDRGVGAIYLGNVTTPFSVKDADNQLQGQVRSTGLFVGEKGNVGTVQQVDLVV